MPMAVLQRQPLVTELTVCPNLDELTDRPGRPQHLELDHRTRRSQPSLDQRTRHRVHLRVTQPHQRALVSEVPLYRSHAEDIVASSARSGDPPACNRLRSRRRVAPPTPPPQPTLRSQCPSSSPCATPPQRPRTAQRARRRRTSRVSSPAKRIASSSSNDEVAARAAIDSISATRFCTLDTRRRSGRRRILGGGAGQDQPTTESCLRKSRTDPTESRARLILTGSSGTLQTLPRS